MARASGRNLERGQAPLPIEMPARGIIIVGMHRSGTSLVARMAHLWGASVVDDQALIPADDWNEGGYWEWMPLVRFNLELLSQLGASGWNPPPLDRIPRQLLLAQQSALAARAHCILSESNAGGRPWMWKDPRLAVLLPFWTSLWDDPIYLVPVRHPGEVAASLALRDGASPEAGLALWRHYNTAILRSLPRGAPSLFLDYGYILNHPNEGAERLCGFLNLHCGVEFAQTSLMGAAVRPRLRHAPLRAAHLFPRLSAADLALYEQLRRRAGGGH